MAEKESLNHGSESPKDPLHCNRKWDSIENGFVGKDDENGFSVEEKAEETSTPDGGWGWLVCLGAFITNFVVFGIHNSFGVVYGTLIQELKISSAETAWIGSLGMGLNFFFGPISSALCERIGCRLTSFTGTVLAVSGLLLSSFITRNDVSKMYATYGVMWGLGSSLCYVSSMVILGQYFNKRMALANGLGTSGSGFGTLIMAPVIQKFLATFGWRTAFRFLSGTASLLFIAVWLFRPLPGRHAKNEETAHPCVDLNIWRNKAFIVWVLSISFFLFGYFIPFIHLVRLAGLLGIPTSKAAWLIAFLSIASTIGRVFFGKIGDLQRVNRLAMFQVSILIIGASTALLSLATDYTALVFYAVTFGFFDGCFVGQVAVVTSQIVGMKHLAVALGYLFGSIALPMTLGPPVAGWIYDGSQSYNVAFYVAGSTSFLGFLTMFFIPRLVKKYAAGWEKEFDFRRRASIESRRKLMSNTLSDHDPEIDLTVARNSFYEVDVFHAEDNNDVTSALPLTPISVERPQYTGGRRRSLPALYISNSSHSTNAAAEKARQSPGLKIARLSGELSSMIQSPGTDDRASCNDSPLFAQVPRNGAHSAPDKPRPNRVRARRGSLPVISHKPGLQGNVVPLVLVDASLLVQQGVPLVSVNAPPKMNLNKRRGSLPVVNHPAHPGLPKQARPRAYDLGRRRGSLPAVSLPIPEVSDDQNLPGNATTGKTRMAKHATLNLPSRDSQKQAIDEREEENHDGPHRKRLDNVGTEGMRLSSSSGYSTNGHVNGSAGSTTSLATDTGTEDLKEYPTVAVHSGKMSE